MSRWARAVREPMPTPCFQTPAPVWFWPSPGCVVTVWILKVPPPCREAQDRGCSSGSCLFWGFWFHILTSLFSPPAPAPWGCHHLLSQKGRQRWQRTHPGRLWPSAHVVPSCRKPGPHLLFPETSLRPLCGSMLLSALSGQPSQCASLFLVPRLPQSQHVEPMCGFGPLIGLLCTSVSP